MLSRNIKHYLVLFKLLLLLTFSKDMLIACDNLDSTEVLLEIKELPQNGSQYELIAEQGQILVLKIRGNPTTGYLWSLENYDSLNKEVLKPLNIEAGGRSRDYIVDPHRPGFVGVPGYYYFKFQALETLNEPVVLRFVHKRPWSNEDSRTISVKVNIN